MTKTGDCWALRRLALKKISETPLCKHYFTMPFIVLDKSLHTSGIGSEEFNLLDGHKTALPSVDATIHKDFSHEESIVITSQSFESLLPGKEMGESVCDLCLTWWVYTSLYIFICILFKIWIICTYVSLILHTKIGWQAESHSYIPSVVNSLTNWHHIIVMCGWKLLPKWMWMYFNIKYSSFLPHKTITNCCMLCLDYRMCWIVVKTTVIVIAHALFTWKLESKSWIKALFQLLQTRPCFLWTCFIVHALDKKTTKLWICLVQEWCLRDGQKVRTLDVSLTLFQWFLLIFYACCISTNFHIITW